MTSFTRVPPGLYRQAEPEAGKILPALTGRLKSCRPAEVFDPDWDYVLTSRASTVAVVSALCCAEHDVPEHVWPQAMRVHCPKAWRVLADAGISFEQWNAGRCDAVLSSRIGATANNELGGYEVFAVMDVPAAVASVVDALGAVPVFTDEPSPDRGKHGGSYS